MVTIKEIEDMLTTTHNSIEKGKFTDISQELHDYIVMPWLLTQQGGLLVKQGGVGIEETLMVAHGGRSRFVGEYDEDTAMVIDHLKKIQLFFCLLTDSLAYTRGEILANRGEERINNVILPRRRALYLRVAETMEEAFFQTPDPSDDKTPWGLKYWIVKNSVSGFNGGYPTGFTRVAGLNLTEVPAYKNYTDTYTVVSKDDLITKMRRAHRQTKWKTAKKMAQFEGDTSDRRIILVNEDTLESMENIGEAQNENLGRDLAPYTINSGPKSGLNRDADGEIIFKRKPIIWAEPLDNDTSDPIYGTDLATFHAITRSGDNMRLDDFKQSAKQHRVFEANLDHAIQFLCVNRRNNWVVSK
jgi:hypothetical protein